MRVWKIETQEELEQAFEIRREVFVQEQEVAPAEEFDEFEDTSTHFLVTEGNVPCGTARWRFTDNGIKLERFAVLGSFRGRGVGSKLVEAVLKDLKSQEEAKNKAIYMHAQLTAVSLYRKFGFKIIGDNFLECGIEHAMMQK